jgi:UDP-glucose 4-epimerase
MRIMVTGGAGFIGSHVADALLDRGHEVLVLDDLSSGRRENVPDRATFIEGDIRDGTLVERVVADFRPEIIDHQAAQTSVAVSTREPARDAEINVLGGIQVLEAARKLGVRHIVFASTGGAIYGEVPEGQRAKVGWPPRPLSPYACSKLGFEGYLGAYHHEHGLPFTVLRYANVYGPRQDPHGEAGVVAIFSQRLCAGEPIRVNAKREEGDAGCIRDYVFVGDVVQANVLAVEGKIDQPIVNVCTGTETSTLDLAKWLSEALGVTPEIGHGPRRAGDLERSVLDPEGSAIESPISVAEGLSRTAEWFKSQSR